MARRRGPVLVDTNVVLESYRVQAWRALAGGYRLETVDACVIETQTGFQRRREERRIDSNELYASLANVHSVEDRDRAELAIRVPDIALHDGEAALWAHILKREDDWVMCGPDTASLRVGVRLGFRERLVSMERLLHDVGYRPRIRLNEAYTRKWLEETLGDLVLAEVM